MLVDLGSPPPRTVPAADRRPGINGMDFAQLYERAWLIAFDPALPEAVPAHASCYEREALQLSPVRCAGAACPYYAPGAVSSQGGCAATDALGLTQPPRGWRYQPTSTGAQERRCLAPGCLVSAEKGSTAWARA